MTGVQQVRMRWMSCLMEDGATQMDPKVAVEVTIHDLMAKYQLRGVGRSYLFQKYLEICRQSRIYYQNLGGTVGFEFKTPYKLCVLVQ